MFNLNILINDETQQEGIKNCLVKLKKNQEKTLEKFQHLVHNHAYLELKGSGQEKF